MSRIPKKYFFTFASTCLSGLFMLMSIRLYEFLVHALVAESGGGDIGKHAGTLFLASIVLVIAVVKSGGWAAKIFEF